ncbi:MAG: pyridoxal-phosphate dependent enzyme [Myxococcaceae bacterium]
MNHGLPTEWLDPVPRLGWVRQPTGVTSLPALSRRLGLGYLGVKRDDECAPLLGGTKPRKLDYLLAASPWADASAWVSMGAIGSGHLVALGGAAKELSRSLHSHLFWEPISAGVLDNLAFTATHSALLRFHRSRATLALRAPGLLLAKRLGGAAVIPPGATCAPAMVGLVRAGLELAAQVKDGELPEPERLYVAYGSGGTVAGLSWGLGLGGVRTVIHAVATVERPFSTRWQLRLNQDALARHLGRHGLETGQHRPVPVVIDRSQLGRGYGQVTPASLAACELALREGLGFEPVYTGKAFAALLADAAGHDRAESVLFWQTNRRGPLHRPPGWRERLPVSLSTRLTRAMRGLHVVE